MARAYESEEMASFLETYADWLEAHLDEWTTTDDGVLLAGVKRHYMRIRPPAEGEPFYNPGVPAGAIHIANRGPEERADYDAREVVDAGFLELVRYGVRRADDPLIVDSLKVIDATLKVETPEGPCWRRYNHDGYGQKKNGGPYDGWGQGRAWPLLLGERAHYELAAGGEVKPLIAAYERFSSAGGMLPEQIWDSADLPEEGMYLGQSAGSAQPLVWAHAEYLKLLRSVTEGQVFDVVLPVQARYARPVAEREFASTIEIFQRTRTILSVPAGHTLRLLDPDNFHAVWSADEWATVKTTESRNVGYPGAYVDIHTTPEQRGSIVFTIFLPEKNSWLGRNYEVKITPPPSAAPVAKPADTRPAN